MSNLNENFLLRMESILKDEYDAFFSALVQPLEKAVYVNANKIKKNDFLKIVDFKTEQIPYEPCGFYVDGEKKGRHPLHHCGAFYMQEPNAMFTVNCFNFNGNETVLDLCASPGGKSIQIANKISNGFLISNEVNRARCEVLFSNIERMGLKNVIVTNDSTENVCLAYADSVDVCLVDAPCSGEGMFRRGEFVSEQWNENLPIYCASRQLEILEDANKAVKNGGYIIYSTCTYSVEENEDVVKKFMAKHNYQLVNFKHNFNVGVGLEKVARLYPHKSRGEGQFVTLMQKCEDNFYSPSACLKLKQDFNFEIFKNKFINGEFKAYLCDDYSYIVPDIALIKRDVKYFSFGVRVGKNEKGRFEPEHNLFSAFGKNFKNTINLDFKADETKKILHGETIEVEFPDCYGAVLINNCALSGFKISQGKFKNLYPRGLRNFK